MDIFVGGFTALKTKTPAKLQVFYKLVYQYAPGGGGGGGGG